MIDECFNQMLFLLLDVAYPYILFRLYLKELYAKISQKEIRNLHKLCFSLNSSSVSHLFTLSNE